MNLKSKVSIARPGSTSLRATVPEGIAVFLGLNEGDTLEWGMVDTESGRVATVTKVK